MLVTRPYWQMTTIYLGNCQAVALSHYGRAVDGFVWSSDRFQNAWTTKCHSRRPVLQKLLFRVTHHPFLHYPRVSFSEDKVGRILMTSLNTLWPLTMCQDEHLAVIVSFNFHTTQMKRDLRFREVGELDRMFTAAPASELDLGQCPTPEGWPSALLPL